MELSDLLTFSTVARLGGITRAADELNTVQSNVTQRVKALEAEIGTALFERHSRGMTLTGAGRRLLPYAQRMAALSREALLAARDDGEPKGPLAIGSMETTAAVRLPSLLAEFHRRFPAVRLTLRTSTTADLVAGVLNGTFDGAFVAGPIDHAELDATVAFREELVLVTARQWSSLAALRAGNGLHDFRMDRRRGVVVEVTAHDHEIIASPLTLSNKTTRQYFQALPILPPRFPGTVKFRGAAGARSEPPFACPVCSPNFIAVSRPCG